MGRTILIDSLDDERLGPFRLRERELRPRHLPAPVIKGLADADAERIHRGMFVAEGDLVVERALAAGCRPVAVLVDADAPPAVIQSFADDVPVYAASAQARKVLTGLGVALAVIALFERPAPMDAHGILESARRLMIFEDVDNPTNVGAIVRSAAAFGIDGLILDRNSSDPLARRALRVSMGTIFGVPSARVDDVPAALERLQRDGVVVCGLTPQSDALPIGDVAARLGHGAAMPRVAVVMGSERDGLSARSLAAMTHRVRIPMANGVDSLNVAAAAAVACYAIFGP